MSTGTHQAGWSTAIFMVSATPVQALVAATASVETAPGANHAPTPAASSASAPGSTIHHVLSSKSIQPW